MACNILMYSLYMLYTYMYIYPIYPTHTHQVHWTRAMKPRLWCALLSLWQWRAFFSVHQNGTSLKIVVVNYQIC